MVMPDSCSSIDISSGEQFDIKPTTLESVAKPDGASLAPALQLSVTTVRVKLLVLGCAMSFAAWQKFLSDYLPPNWWSTCTVAYWSYILNEHRWRNNHIKLTTHSTNPGR
jgi:hypothetical protein